MYIIPEPAKLLLDRIQKTEAPRGYNTIYANAQTAKPLTTMTLAEVQAAQSGWTKKNGSSAAGGMQIMKDTLAGIIKEMGLRTSEKFTEALQRNMGYHLLLRRGYMQFMVGQIDVTEFGKRIAQEWASFPVLRATRGAHRQLKRGQSYYAGDGVNKPLTTPAQVEAVLNKMRGIGAVKSAGSSAVAFVSETSTVTKVAASAGAVAGTGAAVVAGTQDAQTTLDQIAPITDTVSLLGSYGAYVAGGVVAIILVAFVGIALYKWARE